MYNDNGHLIGVEAVIDKDLCSSLLARELEAEMMVIATDVPAIYLDWGTPNQRSIRHAHPDALLDLPFAQGSMGPKVEAACEFARLSGKTAVIGALDEIDQIVNGSAGTRVSTAFRGIEYH
jgi:carbamate kinase